MLWVPELRLDVLYTACPPARFIVVKAALPSMKVTVPVGFVVGEVTLAVKRTV